MAEPLRELPCNPYINPNLDDVRLKCIIAGPELPDDSQIEIEWIRILEGENDIQVLESASPALVEVDTFTATPPNAMILTSVLTLKDATFNNIAGTYWCVVMVTADSPRVSHLKFISEPSTPTVIPDAVELQGDDRLCESVVHTNVSTACVAFQELPPFLTSSSESDMGISMSDISSSTAPPVTTDKSISPSPGASKPPKMGRGDLTQDPLLSMTMIIILCTVGGGLCIVIHVLLAIVAGLCIKSRKRIRGRQGMLTCESREEGGEGKRE